MNLLFLDTETTSVDSGRLVQLAMKASDPGSPSMSLFFKPPVPIEFEAMAVHHITNEKVESLEPFGEIEKERIQKILNEHILVAHNAKFDVGVLTREGLIVEKRICTLKVARRLFDFSNYKLQFLRYKLGLEVAEVRAHDAEGDIEILEALFSFLVQVMERDDHDITRDQILNQMMEWTRNPSLLNVLGFGKYKGQTFAQVARSDRGYLEWLRKQPEIDEDLIFTINQHLK